jgi:predicted transcriptional regulator
MDPSHRIDPDPPLESDPTGSSMKTTMRRPGRATFPIRSRTALGISPVARQRCTDAHPLMFPGFSSVASVMSPLYPDPHRRNGANEPTEPGPGHGRRANEAIEPAHRVAKRANEATDPDHQVAKRANEANGKLRRIYGLDAPSPWPESRASEPTKRSQWQSGEAMLKIPDDLLLSTRPILPVPLPSSGLTVRPRKMTKRSRLMYPNWWLASGCRPRRAWGAGAASPAGQGPGLRPGGGARPTGEPATAAPPPVRVHERRSQWQSGENTLNAANEAIAIIMAILRPLTALLATLIFLSTQVLKNQHQPLDTAAAPADSPAWCYFSSRGGGQSMGASKATAKGLSRREREIMEVIYRRGQATAAEVLEGMPDPPSYSAVRAMLRVLEEKGHLRHEQRGPRYVFLPTVPREQARRSALRQLVQTFFDGSTEQAVAALLDQSDSKLSGVELDRLARLIDQARKEGR